MGVDKRLSQQKAPLSGKLACSRPPFFENFYLIEGRAGVRRTFDHNIWVL